jgi:CDP-diacylglycerol--glycerol-3-phosphate 3-phosphatidyltransferase
VSATTSSPTTAVPSNWNIANGLTALRIAMVPLFAAILLHGDGKQTDWRIAASVAFAVAVATDRIDGELARSRGLVTNLGKIADPIADKALIGAALISLSMLDELWWSVTVLILARELGITLLRFMVIRHGVMPAGRGGKAKTVAQSLAILIYIAPLPDPVQPVAKVAMAVAVALTLVTGLDYMLQAYRMREGSERTRLKRAARRALRRPARPDSVGPDSARADLAGSDATGSDLAGSGPVAANAVGSVGVDTGTASVDEVGPTGGPGSGGSGSGGAGSGGSGSGSAGSGGSGSDGVGTDGGVRK